MLPVTQWVQRIAFLGLVAFLFPSLPQAAEPEKTSAARKPATVAGDIDRELDRCLTAKKVPASPLADDAEFLRRAYLDLVGRIPTADKAAAFLDSKDTDKRAKLIDELLASPDYGRHFATVWTNLIVANGDADARPATRPFVNWLTGELNQGRSWDKTVFALLTAEGKATDSPATLFTLANSSQPGMLGSAATKLFLGVQIQCAECHNHPFAKWQQTDYWGMAAFFGRLKGAGAKNNKGEVIEVVDNKANAKKGSVAASGNTIKIPATGGNKGAGKVVPARFLEGDQPELPAEGAIRPNLATWLTAADNPFFARATVNRLWAHFFGRGFVNPVDDFENGAEPSHPELLALLARDFTASGHDCKHLVRCICNSQAYQRTSRPLADNKDDETLFSHMAVKVMTPEVMYDSLTTAMGVSALPGGLGSQPRYGDGKGKNAKGGATAKGDPREEFIRFFNTKEEGTASTEYTHGIPQILGLMNNAQFNRATPVIDKLVKANVSAEKAVDELFLATLARRPTSEESARMTAFLGRRSDAQQGYSDILWILFNTSEFVLNH